MNQLTNAGQFVVPSMFGVFLLVFPNWLKYKAVYQTQGYSLSRYTYANSINLSYVLISRA